MPGALAQESRPLVVFPTQAREHAADRALRRAALLRCVFQAVRKPENMYVMCSIWEIPVVDFVFPFSKSQTETHGQRLVKHEVYTFREVYVKFWADPPQTSHSVKSHGSGPMYGKYHIEHITDIAGPLGVPAPSVRE